VIYLLYALHIIVCLFLILVVLLQQGKGADLSVFGGGSTQTAFGARGAATVLHKLTVASFIAFIVTTVGIAALLGTDVGSILTDDAVQEAPAAPVPAGETIPETALEEDTEEPTEDVLDDEGGAANLPSEAEEPVDQAP
jgi:preprotein translocase subunit SecG